MRNRSGILISIAALVLVLGGVWTFGAITVSEPGAQRAAETMGFTEVQVANSGFMFTSWRGCDDKDYSWYKVNAVNPTGESVELTVCRGLFKGYTVRVQ